MYIDKKISVIGHKGEFYVDESCVDEVGHGTAITDLFLKKIENLEKLNLSFIKLDNNTKMGYDLEQLIFAIEYIDNMECDVLLISLIYFRYYARRICRENTKKFKVCFMGK